MRGLRLPNRRGWVENNGRHLCAAGSGDPTAAVGREVMQNFLPFAAGTDARTGGCAGVPMSEKHAREIILSPRLALDALALGKLAIGRSSVDFLEALRDRQF